jgi:protein-disulfide isomerase
MSVLKVPVTKNDHTLGDDDAPVTLLEYGDFECPHCGAAHPIVKALLRQFGDQVRYVYRHFPLTQVHPNAEAAAETAEFAGSHDRFWQMHDLLFENQNRLGMTFFLAAAGALGLPLPALRDALASGQFAPKVRGDFNSGVRSGVNGTPTFFVNGHRHEGSYAFEELAEAVNGQLVTASRHRRRA